VPDLIRFSVMTPGKTLLDAASVSKVRLKLADQGWLSIYPRHAPLLAETFAGPVTYTTAGEDETIFISEGILQVADNDVTVFTGGELVSPTPPPAPDADDAHFDRLASVLLKSLSALPAEGLGDFDFEGAGERG